VPFIKAWHRDYAARGLVVVGVHAPEFEFGKRAENIDRGIRDHGLTYPIAFRFPAGADAVALADEARRQFVQLRRHRPHSTLAQTARPGETLAR
jgi:hypothetical protein